MTANTARPPEDGLVKTHELTLLSSCELQNGLQEIFQREISQQDNRKYSCNPGILPALAALNRLLTTPTAIPFSLFPPPHLRSSAKRQSRPPDEVGHGMEGEPPLVVRIQANHASLRQDGYKNFLPSHIAMLGIPTHAYYAQR